MPDQVWRLIDTDAADPYFVTAADEVLAHSRGADECPDTLHFYRRRPPGVSVGYFKKIEEDVDLEMCKELGVKVVRRTSGGGTIYTDEGQLIYGLATKSLLADGIEATFEAVCGIIIDALDGFGIKADYKPPNDVLINGHKVSGNAQTHKTGAILQHGTVILRTDPETIEKVLKVERSGYVSSIEQETGDAPGVEELKASLVKEFEDRFGVRIEKGEFTVGEMERIQKLVEEKYSTDAWNFKR